MADDIQALELEPDATRLSALAWRILWIRNTEPKLYDLARALDYAQKAVALDPKESRHQAVLAHVLVIGVQQEMNVEPRPLKPGPVEAADGAGAEDRIAAGMHDREGSIAAGVVSAS